MKKGIFWTITVIICALIVLRIVQHQYARGRVEKESNVPAEVVVTKAMEGKIAKRIAYSGNIAGIEQVNVYPMEETGRLLRYLVKEGDRVSKGSVVALVDRSIKGLNYKPATITSPISGIVGMLFLNKGAAVVPQIPVAMIANTDKVKVKIQISEKELKIVEKGQETTIGVDMYSDTTFSGILEEITPVINPLSRTATGEITVNNPHHLLKVGMLARVQLIVEEHKNALIVPKIAVLKKAGEEMVFVRVGDKAQQRKIKTDIKDKGFVEVIQGLKEGEEVIISGNYGLRDGARISLKEIEKTGGQQ